MNKQIPFKSGIINFYDEGEGTPVVFLHGYLESSQIWESFTDKLIIRYRVVRIDLPGHGKSSILAKIHTMELMAEAVKQVLDNLGIKKCILIGHSMGGYVAIAFAELFSEYLKGLCLFHSTPYADTEEKKQNRDREIELVNKVRIDLIVTPNIPNAFANDNLEILKEKVEFARQIALKTPDEGIISVLEGMKARKDRTQAIANIQVPLCWILGKKDNYIDFDNIKSKIEMNEKGELVVFENSGHMGFIEEPEKSVKVLCNFVDGCME